MFRSVKYFFLWARYELFILVTQGHCLPWSVAHVPKSLDVDEKRAVNWGHVVYNLETTKSINPLTRSSNNAFNLNYACVIRWINYFHLLRNSYKIRTIGSWDLGIRWSFIIVKLSKQKCNHWDGNPDSWKLWCRKKVHLQNVSILEKRRADNLNYFIGSNLRRMARFEIFHSHPGKQWNELHSCVPSTLVRLLSIIFHVVKQYDDS